MDGVTILGLCSAAGSTISFLPQARKVYKNKRKTRDLSLGMYVLMTLSLSGWWTYGLLQNDWPLIIANSVSVPVTAYILFRIVKNLLKSKKKA